MKHSASPKFWADYEALPTAVQKRADADFALLKPRSGPSISSVQEGGGDVGQFALRYRALAAETGDAYLWFWIGSHADYDRLIG